MSANQQLLPVALLNHSHTQFCRALQQSASVLIPSQLQEYLLEPLVLPLHSMIQVTIRYHLTLISPSHIRLSLLDLLQQGPLAARPHKCIITLLGRLQYSRRRLTLTPLSQSPSSTNAPTQ